MLLSRVADDIYWAARYLERAEDTARIVRAHAETVADLPGLTETHWKPLITVVGSDAQYDERFGGDGSEAAVVDYLLSDQLNPGSVVRCVSAARENLRTSRETIPVEGWQAVNDLHQYVNVEVRSRRRPSSARPFHATCHQRQPAHRRDPGDDDEPRRGVRHVAARSSARACRHDDPGARRSRRRRADRRRRTRDRAYDDLLWMGVLKSLSGLQMYRRAVRRPIEGPAVVHFLLEHDRFPRAVRALLREIRRALGELPDPSLLFDEVDAVDAVVRGSTADDIDGAALDDAMESLQDALAQLDRRIHERYLRRSARSCVPRPRRPLMAARSLALTRSHRCRTPMNSDTVLERLTSDRPALIRRQAEADRVLAASSAGHLVHEMNVHRRPWRVDPVPLVLDGATFERLAAGVVERVEAMERVLADLYGPRTLVADGVVPGEALSSTTRYRIGSVGLPPPASVADDVCRRRRSTRRRDVADRARPRRCPDRDRLRLARPGGDVAGGRGLECRRESRHSPASPASCVAPSSANTAVASPRIVLLSGGVEHAGYVEDSQLARLLGFTLIERPDVVVRQGRLWLRTLGGLDPIDVVYRRVDDDETDPIELAAAGGAGVPGVLSAVAGGGVVLANAHGCGLLEDIVSGAVLAGGRRGAQRDVVAPATAR